MSKWLDHYREELAQIRRTSAVTRNSNSYDIARSIINAKGVNSLPPVQVAPNDEGNIFTKIVGGVMDNLNPFTNIGRAIDLAGRPLNAVNSLNKDLTAQTQENAQTGNITPDIGRAGSHFLQGLLGNEHTTGHDLVEMHWKDPDPENTNWADWVRGTVGLGSDIASDPLNLVGGLAAKPLKEGLDALGRNVLQNKAKPEVVKAVESSTMPAPAAATPTSSAEKAAPKAEKAAPPKVDSIPDLNLDDIPSIETTPTAARITAPGPLKVEIPDKASLIRRELAARVVDTTMVKTKIKKETVDVDSLVSGVLERNPNGEFINHPGIFLKRPDSKIIRVKPVGLQKALEEGRVGSQFKDFKILVDGKYVNLEKYVKEASARLDAEVQPGKLVPNEDFDPTIDTRVIHANEQVEHQATTGENLQPNPESFMLTDKQKADVANALTETVGKDFVNVAKTHPYTTKTGTKKTGARLGEGEARNVEAFNKFTGYTLYKNIFKTLNSDIQPEFRPAALTKLTGGAKQTANKLRATALYDALMPKLAAAESSMRLYGVEPVLGQGHAGMPLSMHDILDSMPRAFVERHLLSGTNELAHHIPPTRFMDMARAAIRYVAKEGGGVDALKSKEFQAKLKAHLNEVLLKGIGRANEQIPFAKAVGNAARPEKYRNAELDRALNAFVRATPKFIQKLENNSKRLAISYGEYVKAVETDAIGKFANDLAQYGANPDKIFAMVDNSEQYAKQASEALEGIAPPNAEKLANAAVIDTMAESVPYAEIKAEVAGAKEAAKATSQAEKTVVTKELLDDAEKAVDNATGNMIRDVGEKAAMSQTYRFLRAVFPVVGEEAVRPILTQYINVARRYAELYRRNLSRLAQTYTHQEITEAWRYVKEGMTESDATLATILDPRVRQAAVDLKRYSEHAVNPTLMPEHGIVNRVQASAAQINRYMARRGLPFEFDGRKKNLTDWTEWDVKDPLDFLSKVNAAVMDAHVENLTGAELAKMFGKGSGTKIVDTTGHSILGKSIPAGTYFDDDIAKQIHVLDSTMQELMKPVSSNKLLRLYDGVMRSYKTNLTIVRPGHHFRNMYGDIWLGAMDGMYSPTYYNRMFNIMRSHKSLYKDLSPIDPHPAATGKTGFTFTFNGKKQTLSEEETYRLMANHGVLNEVSTVEDFGVDEGFVNLTQAGITGPLRNINPLHYLGKMTDGKVKPGMIHNAAVGVSETRDHFVRGAHFLYAMEKDAKHLKGANLQDALDIAATKASERARKWHPDGSDLSTWERKYPRRIMVFYSWIRKAIPLVLETALVHPARLLAYNKAYSNIAQANGIDPSGGMEDPFPTDQMFPSWLENTNPLGPIGGQSGGYYGLSLGIPSTDILEQYFNPEDPSAAKKTIMGGLTPALEIPAEILTNTSDKSFADNYQTGGTYKTPGDLIAAQIPNKSFIEALLGARLPGQSPTAPSNTGYQPQIDTPVGTLDQRGISVANWLTGLGISDLSRPSYVESAKREMQQRGR